MDEDMRRIRTKVRIPLREYKKLEELAMLLNIPPTTLLTIAMWTIYERLDPRRIEANPPRKWKGTEDYQEINMYTSYIIKDEIEKIKKYSFNEFIIDCINYLIDDEFKNILLYKGSFFSTAHRIKKSMNIDSDEERCTERYSARYSENAKKKYPCSSVQEFVRNKADHYRTSKSGLIKYYVAKEVNRIIQDNPDQQNLYTNPTDYYEY